MESAHQSGIGIELIRLARARVEFIQSVPNPKYHLSLVGYERAEQDEGQHLVIAASFDLMHGVENPIMVFTCTFLVQYKRRSDAAMPWKEFTDALALAHVIPYLREFASNVTGRMPSPVLMLDPVNTGALLADYKRRVEAAATNATATPAAAAEQPKSQDVTPTRGTV